VAGSGRAVADAPARSTVRNDANPQFGIVDQQFCKQAEAHTMSTVAKVIEISSSSNKGIEDAVQSGLTRMASTVKNIRGAWVNEIKCQTEPDGRISEWRVNMRVNFIVD
jgi:flavin-binding protein dodecin